MKIKEIQTQEEKKKYGELALNLGNVFNSLEWLGIFGDRVMLFGICEDSGELTGGFCVYLEKKLNFKLCLNPPFTPCCGLFLRLESKNPVSILSRWKEAVALMAEAIDSLSCSAVSLSLNKDIGDVQPFLWKKFKVSPAYTYVLDLKQPEEALLQGMSSERRNDLRKAEKNRLTTSRVEQYEEVKPLILKTFSRQRIKIDEDRLDNVLFDFATRENSFAFLTLDGESPLAAAFCVQDQLTAYYLFGGYDPEKKHHGAGSLALWEAIKYARKMGLESFDFEGSMVPSIERYFRQFGGQLTSYYRVNKAKLVYEIILKLFKRELF